MERNKLGEYILDHYEKYLGEAKWRRIVKDTENKPAIQMLQYTNVFEGCMVYASMGVSLYAKDINNTCEVVLAVDDDDIGASGILTDVLFYMVKNKIELGRGTYIAGIDNISKEFATKHNKQALYFTETFAFPDDFSDIEGVVKMYMAFFISKEEYEFIETYGFEKFEDMLEEKECDVMDLNR